MAELRDAPGPIDPGLGAPASAQSLRLGPLDGSPAVLLPLGRLPGVAIALLTLAHLGALALRHLADVESGFLDVVSLTSASSFGTWSSSALLGLAAAVALSLGWLVPVDRRRRQGWTAVAALLAALSVDDVVELHERTAETLRRALDLGGPL